MSNDCSRKCQLSGHLLEIYKSSRECNGQTIALFTKRLYQWMIELKIRKKSLKVAVLAPVLKIQ
jgi:hypothetical protein